MITKSNFVGFLIYLFSSNLHIECSHLQIKVHCLCYHYSKFNMDSKHKFFSGLSLAQCSSTSSKCIRRVRAAIPRLPLHTPPVWSWATQSPQAGAKECSLLPKTRPFKAISWLLDCTVLRHSNRKSTNPMLHDVDMMWTWQQSGSTCLMSLMSLMYLISFYPCSSWVTLP